MIYYYTPIFTGQLTNPDTGEPDGLLVKQPGQDTGSGPEEGPAFPPGVRVFKCDDPNTRWVLGVPPGTTAWPGWELKTGSEVLVDYPGLSGVN